MKQWGKKMRQCNQCFWGKWSAEKKSSVYFSEMQAKGLACAFHDKLGNFYEWF